MGALVQLAPRSSAASVVSQVKSPVQNKPTTERTPAATASDLFCAKSYDAICKSPPVSDPTGETSLDYRGEIRALRILRKIVRSNPGWTTEQIENELVQQIYTEDRKNNLSRIFETVRGQMLEYIHQQPEQVFSEHDKNVLEQRIRQVQLDLPVNRETYSDATDLYTKSEIYYESNNEGLMRIRVGGAYVLNTTSEFSIVFTMAHELAHAIDPCSVKAAQINQRVYDELVVCFVGSQWITREEAQCGSKDKTAEVFADWMGAEILARSIKNRPNYSLQDKVNASINAVRDLCDDSLGYEKVNLDYYPTDVIRVKGIFSKNGLLRKELQCANTAPAQPYCRFEMPR
ncbi:hypothetical protein ACLVWU_12320 [Bdellovibrio sp. HCB290]|uniref:hypothetical protein n=1 Tax=Bdellovibrio sp. HCB290 TaxID=3394356 RepID=UPI0039B42A9A